VLTKCALDRLTWSGLSTCDMGFLFGAIGGSVVVSLCTTKGICFHEIVVGSSLQSAVIKCC